MTKPRFSLRRLIAIVTGAAIGSAALANPTELWASAVFSGMLAMLVVALLLAIVRRSIGAIGFSVFGWAYLLLILAPGAETNIVPNLLTTKVLVEAERLWHSPQSTVQSVAFSPQGNDLTVFNSSTGTIRLWNNALSGPMGTTGNISWHNAFQRTGHCLFALLFAVIGSLIAAWLYGGRETQSKSALNLPATDTPS